jgi:hypothetical protein
MLCTLSIRSHSPRVLFDESVGQSQISSVFFHFYGLFGFFFSLLHLSMDVTQELPSVHLIWLNIEVNVTNQSSISEFGSYKSMIDGNILKDQSSVVLGNQEKVSCLGWRKVRSPDNIELSPAAELTRKRFPTFETLSSAYTRQFTRFYLSKSYQQSN